MKKRTSMKAENPQETKQQERKKPRSTRAVAESEEWLFTALQNIGDAVIATDSDGQITFMNPVAEKLTGWTAEEGQGRDCREVFRIISEDTRQESESPVTKVLRDGVISGLANHTLLIARDGTERSIDDSGSPIRDRNGSLTGVVLIFRDVTGHRSAQKTMQEQNAILQTLFDHIPALVAMFDPEIKFNWVNREWQRTTGWTLDDLQRGDMLIGFSDPARLEDSVLHLQLATPGWRDVQIILRDGKRLDVSWANVRLSDGSTIGIGYDVTDRKRAEDQRAAINERMQLAVVETHHRTKNDLQTICGLVDLELMDGSDVVPVGHLVKLRSHVQTLAAIHDLLTWTRKSDAMTEGLSAKNALEEILRLIRRTSGAAAIEYHGQDVMLPVKNGMVLAVVVNELITNAVKHGSRSVTLNLEENDGLVEINVCDDGPGFPQPFKPDKTEHMGLQLVESMINIDLRGKTLYANRPEGGACVQITFPLTAAV